MGVCAAKEETHRRHSSHLGIFSGLALKFPLVRRAFKNVRSVFEAHMHNIIWRVNVDLTQGMLRELDERAAHLNISRQAVIRTLLSRALSEDRGNKAAPKKAGIRATQ